MGKIKNREVDTKSNKIKLSQTSVSANEIDYPIFCLRHLHKDFSLEKCSEHEKASLICQMHRLSKCSWAQIKTFPRHGMGSEKISKDSMKVSIPDDLSEDVDSFLSFRFEGKKPFIGYRSSHIFHVLYIDNNFKAYKH